MSERAMARRGSYRASLRSPDYFAVRHLRPFLESRLTAYVQQDGRVVDIGCGEQPLRPLIESRGATYHGIDVVQNGTNSVDALALATQVPLADAVAHVVVITEVLEHVADTRTAFRELARIVRPGGHVLITIPFVYPLHEEPHDFVRLTPHALRALAAENALEIIELTTHGNELESIALIWAQLFERLPRGPWLLRRPLTLLRMLMNAVTNAIASALSSAFGPILPRKVFTNVVCVLRRP
jgi:SAM-dependent methyltransferase